jgi:hypothetical protein
VTEMCFNIGIYRFFHSVPLLFGEDTLLFTFFKIGVCDYPNAVCGLPENGEKREGNGERVAHDGDTAV